MSGSERATKPENKFARTLAAMRERGDKRTIVLAVPMHALSDEQAERFRELPIVQQAGLRVAVWRGRAAEDPDNRGNPMCGDLESVRDAQAIGLSAQTACCKRKIKKPDGTKITVTCPLFGGCAYQAQIEREADLWIMASDLLTAMGEVQPSSMRTEQRACSARRDGISRCPSTR